MTAVPDPTVRPIGYVEDEPIVRQIGDRELYLGNRHAADPARHDDSFRHVLTLSTDEYPLTTHHRPLEDGRGNDWAAFECAVDTARALFRRDGSLLVHCTAGVSRSSTVVAATLAAEEARSLRRALDLVEASRPTAVAHPALYELAVVYLASDGTLVHG